jgi:AICAR transformylase/IMP cyclohydrolase PurH
MAASRRCIRAVHGGLLAVRDEAAHVVAMREHRIAPIDLVVVNLYPFEADCRREALAITTIASRISISVALR